MIHIAEGLSRFSKDWMAKGINFVGINSKYVETHPDDSPENPWHKLWMHTLARERF
ncbi:MAG: hypothetical protein JJT78_17165 [Leptospira sp.]|nr:hypothetical protein [Leptospira sp.]